jgi:hypothetical protein
MPKESTELLKFLAPFSDEVKETALWLRDFVWDLYPESNELIYDNYNALAFGFSLTDTAGDAFCSIAVFSKWVNFGFNRGSEIADPDELLIGNGSLYRYMKVTDTKSFPVKPVKKLLQLAYVNAQARLKTYKKVIKGETIVKMQLQKKRRSGAEPVILLRDKQK